MFILIISRGYPLSNQPLNGIFEFDQAKALQKQGHKIILLSLDLRSLRRRRRFGKYWKIEQGINILNVSFPLGAIPKSILLFLGKWALRLAFAEVLTKHGKPDVLHAHFIVNGNISLILKNKYKIPLVITEHSSLVNKSSLSKDILRIGNKTYANADKIISVSSSLRQNIKKHWRVDSQVIPNIVDTSIFKYHPRKSKESFNFLSVGDLIYGKGFDILVRGFKEAKFSSNVKLKIVGEGKQSVEIRNMITENGLEKQVQLLGFMNRIDIAKLMQDSDAFVLASRAETFGVVLIEAMLAGLPVISTTSGGPNDFVNKDNGILTPVDDIDAMAKALKQMYNSNNNYNRKAISEQCATNFSPETIGSQLTRLYLKLGN